MSTTRWDVGLTWRSVLVTPAAELAVPLAYVRDAVLRVTNGTVEDEFIERAIRAATEACEEETQTAVMPQTWAMVLSGFPASGLIELVRPPFLSLTSLDYYDTDHVSQTLTLGSPGETSVLVSPSGRYARSLLRPVPGTLFPGTAIREDAVTVTFACGYATAEAVPPILVSGICQFVGELYKQRSLSQVGTSISAAPLDTTRFWKRVW